ncbi:hypothetical protein GCM10010182_28410 [Actinomadura cremea]|nr:hypothetical protein GCM10010182_28410 [Actinomadura cremea]
MPVPWEPAAQKVCALGEAAARPGTLRNEGRSGSRSAETKSACDVPRRMDAERAAENQVWLAFTARALVDPELRALCEEAHDVLRSGCRDLVRALAPGDVETETDRPARPGRRPGRPCGDAPRTRHTGRHARRPRPAPGRPRPRGEPTRGRERRKGVRVSVGIFDLFAYAIPGALYLAFGIYVGVRLDWLELSRLDDPPTVILVGGVIVASYLLGHVTYFLGTLVGLAMPWAKAWADARNEFARRVPQAERRPYMDAHPTVLAAAVEARDRETAHEIDRFRAVGLMIRNCALPLFLGAVAGGVEAVAGTSRPAAISCAVLLAVGTGAALLQSAKLRYWADLKTLETCYWLPGIDAAFTTEPPRPRPRLLPWRR